MTSHNINNDYLKSEYLRLFDKYVTKYGPISAYAFFINRFRLLLEFSNNISGKQCDSGFSVIVMHLEECLKYVFKIRKERTNIQLSRNEVIRVKDSDNRVIYHYNRDIYDKELKEYWKVHQKKISKLNKNNFSKLKLLDVYLYAISENEDICIYSRPLNAFDWFLLDRLDYKRIRHPHLVVRNGLGVYCAGEMIKFQCNDKIFMYLDNKSGHYLPDNEALKVSRNIFKKKLKIDEKNIILLDYYNGIISY